MYRSGDASGRIRAWITLSRPRGSWLVAAIPLLGWGFAHWDRAVLIWRPGDAAVVAAAWVVLHVGTLWLNAARDRDTGDVLFGGTAPPPPGTARLGLIALALALFLAVLAGPAPALCAAGCVALAVLYSHPRTAWKGHPVLGPVVNVVGYGVLSPLAGWLLVPAPPTARGLTTLGAFALAILGATFAAQAFQEHEDRARGDHTLVVTHGPRATLRAARLALTLAGVGGLTLAALGWFPRSVLLAAPAVLASDVWMARWSRAPDGGTARDAHVMVLLGITGLLLAVGGATVDYTHDVFADRPVAGLGTAAGHPPDRARHPPTVLIPLDRRIRRLRGLPYAPQDPNGTPLAPPAAPPRRL